MIASLIGIYMHFMITLPSTIQAVHTALKVCSERVTYHPWTSVHIGRTMFILGQHFYSYFGITNVIFLIGSPALPPRHPDSIILPIISWQLLLWWLLLSLSLLFFLVYCSGHNFRVCELSSCDCGRDTSCHNL